MPNGDTVAAAARPPSPRRLPRRRARPPRPWRPPPGAALNTTEPGRHLLAEIRQQPRALRSLLEHADEYRAAAETLVRRPPSIVRLIGHGSSDAAAAFAVYAFGLLPGWTAVRDSISLLIYYDAQIDFTDSVVVALSQSGQTPDVVAYVERARAQGARTIALTNDPESDPARLAENSLP